MKEVIHLHIGKAGIQLGSDCWQLFCLERGIAPDGTMITNTPAKGLETFFQETATRKYTPRSIWLDLDAQSVDEVSRGMHRQLFQPQQLIAGKQNAASNYAMGYYSKAKQIIDTAVQQIRKTVERCHNLQTFLLYNSMGGGTGSGFTSLLMQKLGQEYQKKMKVGLSIYPDGKLSKSCTEPYNTVMIAAKQLLQQDFTIVLDNKAIYNICQRNLSIQNPVYKNINRVIAQTMSSLTNSLNQDNKVNTDFKQMHTSLVPYPSFNNILSSFAPFVPKERTYLDEAYNYSTTQISNQVFDTANQLARCDPRSGKFMACLMIYQGDIRPKDISASFATLKTKRTIQFVDWSPTGTRLSWRNDPITVVADSDFAKMQRSCYMLSNSTAINAIFQRLNYKFDLLYSKRAFVHWYTREGQEESQFTESREEFAKLQADYVQAEKQDDQYPQVE